MDPTGHLFSAGERIDDRLEVVRLLGTGGMGEVYLADETLAGGGERRVALKMLLPELLGNETSLARFAREVKSAQAIDHPNVLAIYDYLQLEPPPDRLSGAHIPCLVMEFLEGESLADYLEREGPMSSEMARPVVRQMASALGAAHRAGIVHRDLKPDNVFLVPREGGEDVAGGLGEGGEVGGEAGGEGGGEDEETCPWRVVLTDFGVARRRAHAADGELSGDNLTASNVVIGTPEFMAPELLELEEAIPASDLYALGLVAYELVTGVRPFHDEQPLKALFMRVREPAPSPLSVRPDLDPALVRVIEVCLERKPEDRWADAEKIVDHLADEPSGVGTGLSRLPGLEHRLPVITREHLVAGAVGLVMLVLILALVLLYADPASP